MIRGGRFQISLVQRFVGVMSVEGGDTEAIYMIMSPTATPAATTGGVGTDWWWWCCSGSVSGCFRSARRVLRLLVPPPVVSPLPPPYSNNHFLVKLLLDITLLRKECAKGFTPVPGALLPGVEFGVMKDSSGSWEMPGMKFGCPMFRDWLLEGTVDCGVW